MGSCAAVDPSQVGAGMQILKAKLVDETEGDVQLEKLPATSYAGSEEA